MAQLNDLIVTGSSRFLNDVTINEIKTSLINNTLIGTGTAASDKGSGVSPRYFPAIWTFSSGHSPVDGDLVNITIPVAGHSWGDWVSIDGGSTYHPANISGTTRLTTHYGVGTTIQLVFDADGQTNSMTPYTGADAVNGSTITGGCWRVVNFYDTNSDTYNRNRYQGAIKAWGTALVSGNIIVGIDGVFHHLKEGTAFDITYPILYLSEAVAANGTTTNTYDIINFTVTTTQSISLTAYKPVFIKGTLSGTTFTPVSTTPLTQTVPTTNDGYAYMLLGDSTAATSVYLQEVHPIYAYKNSIFGPLDLSKFTGDSFISGNQNIATHNANDMTINGHYYYTSNGPNTAIGASTNDGAMFVQAHTTNWVGQIAQDYRDGDLFVRGKNNNAWQNWKKVMCFEDTFGLYYTAGTAWFEPITRKIFYYHSGTAGWSQQVYSAHGYSDNVYLSFKAGQANGGIMAGLDTNPSEDANYNKIDYCWYIETDGTVAIYESGTYIGDFVSAYVAGDEFSIEYTGGYIRYYYNGVIKREVARAISGKLYFDSSEHTKGTFNIYDFTFGTCANTTYTFAGGTNKITVTPRGGSAQDISVTPSITNNVTGSGTNAYLAKFTGANTIGNGPQLGSSTTTFLTNKGTWAAPPNDNNAVTQTATSTNANYEVLFSVTADNTTRTEGARKNSNLTFNPSTGLLNSTLTKFTADKSVLTGTGTAASKSGSTCYPAKWTFNTGLTVVDGDIFTIKLPVAGHSYGEFISVNNGTNYYPVGYNTTSLLTTHFPVGAIIKVVFKSDGQINGIYPLAGGTATTNVSGGAFYVVGLYDSGNTNYYDRNKYTGTIKAGTSAIVAKNIIVGKDGVFHHLNDGTAFDITYPILYANSAIAANATGTDNYDVLATSLQTTQTITLTAYKPVFIVGTLNGTIFIPASTTPLTQTIPTEFDEYYYILLGIAYSTTNIYLNVDHSIYAYVNGKFSKIFDDLLTHAEGNDTYARGDYSHSEGSGTTAYAGYTHAEGRGTCAGSSGSHAEGYNTRTSNSYSHSEGYGTTASGEYSHAEGNDTKATAEGSHAEGNTTTAKSSYSHAEGWVTYANGIYSHAEGWATTTNNWGAHAEGYYTGATSTAAHGEGYYSTASATASHAEGYYCVASSNYSHAEGYSSTSSSSCSHAEGYTSLANGNYAHAEGNGTKATGNSSHAEGNRTSAKGDKSHSEGSGTTSNGEYSHAEGCITYASANCSHSEGYATTSSNPNSHSSGHYNAAMITGGTSSNTTGTAFVIGNGTNSAALSNAFSVQFNGVVKAASTITASTTADYAEYFEWADENPNNEDRVGYFVTFNTDNKIKIGSTLDEYILGVSSGEPFVLGNGDCDVWNGMVLRDEFRRIIYEPAPKVDDEGNPMYDDQGNPIYEGTRPKINPKYDPTRPYINRADRPEWQAVGMLGVLAVRDNGLCSVNSYCTIAADGTAKPYTNADIHKYRVIHRNSNDVIEIVFR